jgi:hypothetical protein
MNTGQKPVNLRTKADREGEAVKKPNTERERTGKPVKRAELIRAIVERAADRIDPNGKDFVEAVRHLQPSLE